MLKILPEPKVVHSFKEGSCVVEELLFDLSLLNERSDASIVVPRVQAIIEAKFRNFRNLRVIAGDPDMEIVSRDTETKTRRAKAGYKNQHIVFLHGKLPETEVGEVKNSALFDSSGYVLDFRESRADIYFSKEEGLVNSISTLKQLIKKPGENCYRLPQVYIVDYPDIEVRSISTTFAWYAGYGRIGFDSQLWGFQEWKEFIDICSDFKINQLNMCMYGYWPFDFPEFPETTLRDFEMKVWNEESGNWIDIKYSHPNIAKEFLTELIEYAHLLSIRIHAYIGLNSYNGGYSNIHKDKRMVLPKESPFINDFDALCPSDPENIEYLKKAITRVVQLGVDGIIFEESEESQWFCTCDRCRATFLDKAPNPAEAKHEANYVLLKELHKVIKSLNPRCEVGLRAWREPPLVKSREYLEHCKRSIPEDVCLYWAPGLYVGEEEFEKWVEVFGRERICARDSEANAWSSTQGRLFRMFKSNVLRSGEEPNNQFIEKDIDQHIGSLKAKVRGINGYMFEWYGYFLHLFAHAHYGWGSTMEKEKFFSYALASVFGDGIEGNGTSQDILYVLKNILTIHESQISIFPTDFPFLRNKVSTADIPIIKRAQEEWSKILKKIRQVRERLSKDEQLILYIRHFDKIENSHLRNRWIYKLCLASVGYDNAGSEEKKTKYLQRMSFCNDRDFELVKKMYFDINPVQKAGVKSCMYPYHEIKRVIGNILHPEERDYSIIYLGVEALGWLWLK